MLGQAFTGGTCSPPSHTARSEHLQTVNLKKWRNATVAVDIRKSVCTAHMPFSITRYMLTSCSSWRKEVCWELCNAEDQLAMRVRRLRGSKPDWKQPFVLITARTLCKLVIVSTSTGKASPDNNSCHRLQLASLLLEFPLSKS